MYISSVEEMLDITIYDLFGKQIKQLPSMHKIDVSDMQTGIYFIKINTKEGLFVSKFVKE